MKAILYQCIRSNSCRRSHNSNAQSKQSLALLRAALTAPYPPQTLEGKAAPRALEFNLSAVENAPPTPDQIRIILSNLKLPLSTLVSAHPASGGWLADSPEALAKASTDNPQVFRFPVIVNWDDGEAALDVGGVKRMLDNLARKRDKGSVDQSFK